MVANLAAELEGTCQSLEQACDKVGIDRDTLTQDEHTELDGLVFCCAVCDWWCEACEANENPDGGDDVCDDCHEGDD